MSLTERSRVALYQGLITVIDDEQAVEEMMSYFPARDVEEPVTKEFLRAELGDVRVEMAGLGAGLRGEMAALGSALRSEIAAGDAGLRDEMAALGSDLRGEMAAMDASLRSSIASMGSDLRSEIAAGDAGLRNEMATLGRDLRTEIHRMVVINVASLAAFAGVVIAAVRL